jgi:hypothetical protein
VLRVFRCDRGLWSDTPVRETTVTLTPERGRSVKVDVHEDNKFSVEGNPETEATKEIARAYLLMRDELDAMRKARDLALQGLAEVGQKRPTEVPRLALPTEPSSAAMLRAICVSPVAGRHPTRRGKLYSDAEVEVQCDVGYSEGGTGLLELAFYRRGSSHIRYGRFTCLNPDRSGGLVLKPLPVTERAVAQRSASTVLVHAIRFELLELCEKAPEVQCQLQLGGAEGTLRHHEFRFRVPVLLPLFLMPHSVTATMFDDLWKTKDLMTVAASVQLGEDVAQSRDLLRQICTLGGWLTLASEVWDPAAAHVKLRVCATLPPHGCMNSNPLVMLEVHARCNTVDATLLDLRCEDFQLAKSLLSWFLWLLNPTPLPSLS